MSEEPGANGPTGQPEQAQPQAPPLPDTAPSRPPRPDMSDITPPPVVQRLEPTAAVKVSGTLWIVSFAAGLIATLFVFISRHDQLQRIRELVTGLEPKEDVEVLGSLTSLLFWGSLGALVLIIAIEALLVHLMMRRHGRTRWAMLAVLFLHSGVLLVADTLVVASGAEGIYVRLLLVGQLTLAGAGLVISMLPAASAWFRADGIAGRGFTA
jgi:hypothetical protein